MSPNYATGDNTGSAFFWNAANDVFSISFQAFVRGIFNPSYHIVSSSGPIYFHFGLNTSTQPNVEEIISH